METKTEIINEYRQNNVYRYDEELKYHVGDCFLIQPEEDEEEDEEVIEDYAIIVCDFYGPGSYYVVTTDDPEQKYLSQEEIDDLIANGTFIPVND